MILTNVTHRRSLIMVWQGDSKDMCKARGKLFFLLVSHDEFDKLIRIGQLEKSFAS